MFISSYRNGSKFRPSAWPQMLAGSAGIYDPDSKLLRYSFYLRPVYHKDYGYCLYADLEELKDNNQGVYELILWFIESNQLEIKD